MKSKCLLEKYREYLPVTDRTPIISIGEGDTPLIRSKFLEQETGCGKLHFKLEGCNPTGSFKDRGMVVAVAKAAERGNKAIICASTGNTSASAAAYGAVCGLKVFVVVPRGNIAQGKLAQAMIYGAQILAVDSNFDKALELVRAITERQPIILVNSLNPHRIEGQMTASFEIIDALGDAPDYLFIPVGNAGNISAYWKGFVEYKQAGKAMRAPRMMGFQAEGSAAIVIGKPIPDPSTVASAIRIGNPASWESAVAARDESGGIIDMVTDTEILEAYQLLGAREGIFGEPASAASVAGLLKMSRKGHDFSGKEIVCIITGTGLKDPDTAIRNARQPLELPDNLGALEKAIGRI